MKILIVSPFFPLPLISGGHTRLFNIIKHVSKRHLVDLACLSTPVAAEHLAELKKLCRQVYIVQLDSCRRARGVLDWRRHLRRLWTLFEGIPLEASAFFSPAMQKTLERLLRSEEYDVVQVEFTRMAQYFGKSFFERHPARKILADYDLTFLPHLRRYQSEMRWAHRIARYIDYRMNRSYAMRTWQRFDELVVTSEHDKERALALTPRLDVRVVPNGVDLSYFELLPETAERGSLLFLGGVGHFPNVDGLFFFLNHIFPRLKELLGNVNLRIIGAGWDKYRLAIARHSSVELTGFLPDLRCYCSRSDVMVAPLRIGGGTRLKILEAMALGIPVVSTSIACEGIGAEDGREILVADEPDEFARRVANVLSDTDLRSALTARAREMVVERYGWDRLTKHMEDLYVGRARAAKSVG